MVIMRIRPLLEISIRFQYTLKPLLCEFPVAKVFPGFYNRTNNSGLWLQVDASCRRNDPRKQQNFAVSTVQLRSKSCRKKIMGERGSSGERNA